MPLLQAMPKKLASEHSAAPARCTKEERARTTLMKHPEPSSSIGSEDKPPRLFSDEDTNRETNTNQSPFGPFLEELKIVGGKVLFESSAEDDRAAKSPLPLKVSEHEVIQQRNDSSSKNNIFYEHLLQSQDGVDYCVDEPTFKKLVHFGSIKTAPILMSKMGRPRPSNILRDSGKKVRFCSNMIVIEYPHTTVVVRPNQSAKIDPIGNVIIDLSAMAIGSVRTTKQKVAS